MIYDPIGVDNMLVAITYGSHLYGTSTPSSDHDFKVVTLPAYRDLILSKSLRTERFRFDALGMPVGDHSTMPANGYEAEHTPVQKFVHDYLGGQAYAVELVYAVRQGFHVKHLGRQHAAVDEAIRFRQFERLCNTLATEFTHQNVNGMVGFAVKQTFDYVRRGERLNTAREVLKWTKEVQRAWASEQHLGGAAQPGKQEICRLDSPMPGTGGSVLLFLATMAKVEVGSTVNKDKGLLTLKLNGRDYLETTAVTHFKVAVEKLIEQYGDRSTKAAETDVDWKSLSHAVRVYQQVLELLENNVITFPRPNADELLKIRQAGYSLETVKDLLRGLDDEVLESVAASTLPVVDDAFRRRADDYLYAWLNGLY